MKAITISGVIGWDTTAADLRTALKDANGEEVEITISSPGGFVSDGLEMFNLIRNYPGGTTARLSGYAMSMASYIPLAANRIIAEDNAIYMIHNVRGGVFGDHNEIIKYGSTCKGMSRLIAKAYAKRTHKHIDEVEKMMDVETYLFGDEMTEHGFVDEIVSTPADKDAETARAMACMALQDCNVRMSSDVSAMKKDLSAAALLMGAMSATSHTAQSTNRKENTMNIEKLKADHPALYQAVLDAGKALAMASGGPMCGTCACQSCTAEDGTCATCTTRPGECALETARAEGAASERDRIVAVRATALPGHETLIEAMAFDGTSTAADAALAIVAAENKMRGTNLAVLESEAPPVVPVVADEQTSVKTIKRADFNALPLADQRAVHSAGTKIVE